MEGSKISIFCPTHNLTIANLTFPTGMEQFGVLGRSNSGGKKEDWENYAVMYRQDDPVAKCPSGAHFGPKLER